MKRSILALTGLALGAGLVLCVSASSGLAQQGAQPFSANPFAVPAKPGNPFYAGTTAPATTEGPAPNADIAITPADGEWVISVMVYKGPEAHQMARQFVSVLRGKDYALWAYVHDYSPEARKVQETLRQERIDKYRKAFQDAGQTPPKELKIKMPKIEVQDEVAVLVGGYKDQETARRALSEVKKLKIPDPEKVCLDKGFCAQIKETTIKKDDIQEEWINPFTRAWVARNPSMPKQLNQGPEWDMSALRSLNDDESYSLLRCPKKITLVVKEYRLPVTIVPGGTPDGATSSIFKATTTAETDAAFKNAHNLAEMLRAGKKFDAYVLHDRKFSLVTVGAFDSLDDPKIREAQQEIAQFHRHFAQKAQQNPHFDPMVIYPMGVPMKVPH